MISAARYHDFSCGHRVVGHEGKCVHLHGHNYRVHFTLIPAATGTKAAKIREEMGVSYAEARRLPTLQLDEVGRVVDFGVMKTTLCEWLERNWDHRFLMWIQDPMLDNLLRTPAGREMGLVGISFNPTAENMAAYLGRVVAPEVLKGTTAQCVRVVVEETRKCSATWEAE